MGRKNQTKRQTKTQFQQIEEQQRRREIDDLVDRLLKITTATAPQQPSRWLEEQREIEQVLGEIVRLEAEAGENTTQNQKRKREDTVKTFVEWFRANGAKLEGASVATFPGYEMGLKAEMDIEKNSLIIAVPRSMMMTVETAARSPLGSLMRKDHILKNMPNVALAMFLLVEKMRRESFWRPYIDLLPASFTTVLYFTVDELAELKGSPTLEAALKQTKNIARQYAYFYKLVGNSDDAASRILRGKFTYEEYRWAVSAVMTRQNSIPSKDRTHLINALIPLWDLGNHTNGTISTDYNPALNRSECLALRDFRAGEQLFIFYGPRSNADLFVHNGFVYEENENDGYWLRLGVSGSDPLRDKRARLLERLGLPTNPEFFVGRGPEPFQPELVPFLNVFNMAEDELDEWSAREDLWELRGGLEKRSWGFLAARLKLLMATYKTSLEEDEEIVREGRGSPNGILAVRMRATEKRILRNALEYVERKIEE